MKKSKIGIIVLIFFSLLTIVSVIFLITIFKSPKVIKYEWYINTLKMQELSEKVDDSSIIIAFLDTGLSSQMYEVYENRIVSPYNVIQKNSSVLDKIGHGTRMASVAIGTNSGIGISGISQKSRIMPIVIAADSGIINPSHLAEGIYYAVDNGANIINISMGSKIEHEIVTESIKYAHENGVVVIAAVGDYKETKSLYPARNKTVISVQAGSKLGGQYYMSNSSDEIDFRIPGEEIKSLDINGKYVPSEGSSIATSIMSGIVSLLLSKNDDYNRLMNYLFENRSLEYLDIKTLYENY